MEMVLAVAMLTLAAALVGFGIWQVSHPALPGWVKGFWRWPLGENVRPPVPRLMGWSSVLIGAACMPTAYVAAASDRSSTTVVASLAAMLLIAGGMLPWIRAVLISHERVR